MSFHFPAVFSAARSDSDRPGILNIVDEWRALSEAALFWVNAACYPWQRCENGQAKPVMLIPGFGVGDLSLLPLASFCNWLGHRARFVGIVANAGCPSLMLERLEAKLGQIFRENGAPVVVIGHSLGGLYARELAHRHPEQIERVITLGAPVNPPLNSCNTTLSVMADCLAALNGRWKECLTGSCSCGATLAVRRMPPVPVTAIYSRTDGIVDWKGCIGQSDSATLDHVEVMGSHFGMALSLDVFRIIAERLAWPREEPRNPVTSEGTLRLVTRRAPVAAAGRPRKINPDATNNLPAAGSRPQSTAAIPSLQFAAPVERTGQGSRVAVLKIAARRQTVRKAGGFNPERLQ